MQNKSVLISIRPQWCELILRGKKTIEVRKSKPNLKPPFKCYIYCTKAPKGWVHIGKNIQLDTKVIGEFTCNLIAPIAYTTDGLADVVDCKTACMTPLQFLAYGKGKVLYGWRISELIVYDKPKELNEFEGLRKPQLGYEPVEIKRPPQSWCYVKELENGRT